MNGVVGFFVVGIFSVLALASCGADTASEGGVGQPPAVAGLASSGSAPTATGAERQSAEVVVRRLWGRRAVDFSGDVSSDGHEFVFVDYNTGDLAVRDLRTGAARRLTDKGSWEESGEYGMGPKLSRDGRQVAYTWALPHGNSERYELRVIGRDGTGLRTLYRDESVGWIEALAWFPNGDHILAGAYREGGPNQLLKISFSDGASQILTTTDSQLPSHMSFSPDGQSLVFDRIVEEGSENRDIYLMAADGSGEARIVEDPANDFVLGWAPDGEHILFASDRLGTLGAWLLQVQDGEPSDEAVLVRPDMWQMAPIGFAADGSYYFGVSTTKRTVYVAQLDPATGEFRTDPAPVPQPAAGSTRDLYPRWSPDGRFLVYTSGRTTTGVEEPVMISLSVETGETREIGPRGIDPFSPRLWSRDGQFILGGGRDTEGRRGFFKVNVLTGETHSCSNLWGVRIRASLGLSPDEKSLYYMVWLDDGAGIAVRGLEGGMPTLLYRWKGYGTATLSPNGEWLAFGDEEGNSYELLLMPATGGVPEVLVRFPPGTGGSEQIAWTPDGDHVIYRNDREIWSVPRVGGEPRRLDWPIDESMMVALRSIRFSPDGTRIAFDAESGEEELWVMENFLPGH